MIRFRSPVQPAHYVRVADRTFKFVGGRLGVEEPDADAIRAYAQAHPELAIVEVRGVVIENSQPPEEALGYPGSFDTALTIDAPGSVVPVRRRRRPRKATP